MLALAGLVTLLVSSGPIGPERRPDQGLQITLTVLGAVVILVGVIDMNAFAAIGLYLTLLGGAVWTGIAVWHFVSSR